MNPWCASKHRDVKHEMKSCLSLVLSLFLNNIMPQTMLSLHPLSLSGHSGLGKSTLVNTLFKSQVSRWSSGWGGEHKIPKTVEIKAVSHGERDISSKLCVCVCVCAQEREGK